MDLGYAWLKQELHLPDLPLPHASRRGAARRTQSRPYAVVDEYPPSYVPQDETPFAHLEFAFKYDGLNLPVLWHALRAIDAAALAQYIQANPGSKYARMMGFFYEMLTGKELQLDVPLVGGYQLIADPDAYLTSEPVNVTKWRLKDNLLGDANFCPVIARSPSIDALMQWSPRAQLDDLRQHYPPELFVRAASYLYFAETRSSNEIERETPSPQRAQRFVQLLRDAGRGTLADAMSEASLERIQEAAVDPGKRVLIGLRGIQSYVGGSHYFGMAPQVDYPCPPPTYLQSLINGLAVSAERCKQHPVVRAAVASFGLVFIHPFEDGNGRVSRYLIHDVFTRDGLTPDGFIFPVSAVMLKDLQQYKTALEHYSKPIRNLANFDFDQKDNMVLHNAEMLEPLYRFPDLSCQANYLYETTRTCAEQVVVRELDVLRRFDEARLSLREVLDLQDQRLNQLLGLIHQNGGKLSANKRKSMYSDLTDDEVAAAEQQYSKAFVAAQELPAGEKPTDSQL